MAIQGGSILDANGDAITGQTNGSQIALDVGINVAGQQVDPRSIRPLTSGDQVTVAASALPTGASTAANQATEITKLTNIDGKLPSLGQAVSTASVPVVIASDQSPIAVTSTIGRGTLTDHSSSTISTSSTSLMTANPNRKYLVIQNVGSPKLYINFGSPATSGPGSIFLAPNGGSFIMESSFVSTEQLFILSSANNGMVSAKEG